MFETRDPHPDKGPIQLSQEIKTSGGGPVPGLGILLGGLEAEQGEPRSALCQPRLHVLGMGELGPEGLGPLSNAGGNSLYIHDILEI